MRSSKSRSRSKSNRNRSVGNIVNRVFDSSGPEGKVRGTPQQIIDKYNQLARDAQLSGDRVATENFQQHAEHYTRMLGEALREQEARREQQDQQQPQQNRDRTRDREQDGDQGQHDQDSRQDDRAARGRDSDAAPVFETGDSDGDSTLVETPESGGSKPAPKKPRSRKPKPAPQPEGEAKSEAESAPAEGGDSDARAAE